jgi:hypothetical protein
MFFQSPDALADCGRRDAQLLGRSAQQTASQRHFKSLQ